MYGAVIPRAGARVRALWPLLCAWGVATPSGCAYRLGPPEVAWGATRPLPLVHPSNDTRRWYIPVESERLGPHLFFVDSGYSYSTCDDDLVSALGMATRGRVRVKGELGHIRVTKARLPAMDLAGHRIEGLVCQVRDLQHTSSIRDPAEVPVAGVLGIDVLRRFHVVFDPEAGVMELRPPRETPDLPRAGEGVVRMRREFLGIRARMPLSVDGHETWPIVDTGASETYLDLERLGLEADWQQANVTVRGTGGSGSEVRTLSFYDATVRVGARELGAVTVTGRPRAPGVPGLVGLDILGQLRAEYDFDARRARFTPVAPADLPSWAQWRARGALGGGTILDAGFAAHPHGSASADLSRP